VSELNKQWANLNKLQTRYAQYGEKHNGERAVDQKNKAQHQLRETFDPFFAALHEGLKQLDKTVRQHEKQQTEQAQADGKRGAIDRKIKALKTALVAVHKEVKNAEAFYQHIRWLQERFPNAEDEDVTGLCKLASPAEVTTGATMQHIKRKELDYVKVNLPPVELYKQFDKLVSPILEQKLRLTQANRMLIQSRDRLLPRLISGKLSVDNLDIQFPPEMAEELKTESTATTHA
jgi:hypothetical protein